MESSAPLISETDIKQSARWPILLYLGLVFSAPFIIWKLVGPLVSQGVGEDWVTGEGEHYQATTVHTFTAEREGELSIQARMISDSEHSQILNFSNPFLTLN